MTRTSMSGSPPRLPTYADNSSRTAEHLYEHGGEEIPGKMDICEHASLETNLELSNSINIET